MKRYEVRKYHDGPHAWFAVVRGCESVYESTNYALAHVVCQVLNAEHAAMKKDALRESLRETLDKLDEND